MDRMDREYHKLWYRLDGSDYYLIWYTTEIDGIFVDSEGRVPVFRREGSLENYAMERGLEITPGEPILHDLEKINCWLEAEFGENLEYECILNAWNMFDDVFKSIGKTFSSKSELENSIYDKLFYGSNLPVITPKGQRYDPVWTFAEISFIRTAMELGIEQLRTSAYCQD
ncbi:hypothetical protein [Microbulbifer pacificus]|uniref:Uncharacterized protein n=1 Tax=Microbulbifer pacificus TaxID=407164 RepID=A0AAU0MY77_9GAMM|nr:hypothetical protein [Microbulbifer pacificus]WOX05058.1 hypothetical protein R5R33_15115 [Microbulbifer pacificus]